MEETTGGVDASAGAALLVGAAVDDDEAGGVVVVCALGRVDSCQVSGFEFHSVPNQVLSEIQQIDSSSSSQLIPRSVESHVASHAESHSESS